MQLLYTVSGSDSRTHISALLKKLQKSILFLYFSFYYVHLN